MAEVIYSYRSSFGHAFQGAARYRRQQRFASIFLAVKVIIGLALAGLMVLGFTQKQAAAAQLFGVLFLLYLWFLALAHGMSAYKLRRVHGLFAKVELEMSKEGLLVREGKKVKSSPWSLVGSATIHQDGIILDGEKGVVLWLPDSALSDANQKGVARQLVQESASVTKMVG